MNLRLRISKDAYKFSSAHMTVFPDGTKENLHGHNYQVEVEIGFERAPGFEEMIDFRLFKTPLKSLCDAWDEKILLARGNPHFRVLQETPESLEFQLCGRRYALPTNETVLLDTDNVTAENLAVLLLEAYALELRAALPARRGPLALALSVFETRGQGATATTVL